MTPAREAAAEELAASLQALIGQLASTGARPKRVLYGRGTIKRLSPKGYVLNESGPQLLLPDGRIWHYHRRRNPEGIFYDASVDHQQSMHGSIPVGGERFSYLGAVVRGYSLGYRHRDDSSPEFELGAIVEGSGAVDFVPIDEALGDIVALVRG